jgi:predicted nucleic acid-binding protein
VNERPKFFLDSNIFIYSFDAMEVAKRSRAIEVVDRISRARSGVISVQVLNESYVNWTRRSRISMPPDEASGMVNLLIRRFRVLDLTLDCVETAIRLTMQHSLQYWDALLCATALKSGVSYLLSEDMQDGRELEGIRIINPLQPDFDLSLLD